MSFGWSPKVFQIWTTTLLLFGRKILEKSFYGTQVRCYAMSTNKGKILDHLMNPRGANLTTFWKKSKKV
jgi:hypothetical protein